MPLYGPLLIALADLQGSIRSSAFPFCALAGLRISGTANRYSKSKEGNARKLQESAM